MRSEFASLHINIDLSMNMIMLHAFRGKTTLPKKTRKKRIFVYVCHVHACDKPKSNPCSAFTCVPGPPGLSPPWIVYLYLWVLSCTVCAIWKRCWVGPFQIGVLGHFEVVRTVFLTSQIAQKHSKHHMFPPVRWRNDQTGQNYISSEASNIGYIGSKVGPAWTLRGPI